MLKTIKVLPLATTAMLGTAAWAPLPKTDTGVLTRAVEPIACVGYRRNYKSFSHCWAVIIKRVRPNWASSYCSRICS